MPRRRTSNKPLKRRIKLETARDVQSEMGKRYRAVQHGELARSDATKDVFILDKIRAGLPDIKQPVVCGVTTVNIVPIQSANFFVAIDGKQCLVDETAARLLTASGRATGPASLDAEPAEEPVPAIEVELSEKVIPLHPHGDDSK